MSAQVPAISTKIQIQTLLSCGIQYRHTTVYLLYIQVKCFDFLNEKILWENVLVP